MTGRDQPPRNPAGWIHRQRSPPMLLQLPERVASSTHASRARRSWWSRRSVRDLEEDLVDELDVAIERPLPLGSEREEFAGGTDPDDVACLLDG